MKLDSKQIVSLTETQENFDNAKNVADKYGVAIIAKDVPKYVLIALTDDEGKKLHKELVDKTSKQIYEKYGAAFKELAK